MQRPGARLPLDGLKEAGHKQYTVEPAVGNQNDIYHQLYVPAPSSWIGVSPIASVSSGCAPVNLAPGDPFPRKLSPPLVLLQRKGTA